jgi:hypothetical protein
MGQIKVQRVNTNGEIEDLGCQELTNKSKIIFQAVGKDLDYYQVKSIHELTMKQANDDEVIVTVRDFEDIDINVKF